MTDFTYIMQSFTVSDIIGAMRLSHFTQRFYKINSTLSIKRAMALHAALSMKS